jgi:hypothetical protein
MDQVWQFYEAAQNNIRREIASMAIATRISFGADKNQWQKFLKEMLPQSKKREREVMSKDQYHQLKGMLYGKRN